MHIPHIINRNALIAYEPSAITLALLNEQNRQLYAENVTREDDAPDTLVAQCLRVIARHFADYPIINDLVLCSDRDYLLEILPTDLPLPQVVPFIEDEIYWMRCYAEKYGVASHHHHKDWTWKCIYLENHMQELIENAQPELNDEEHMEDTTTLLNPYVHRLDISHLQTWKPPLTMDQSEIPEVFPCDHINLEPILRRLENLEEFVLRYGMRNIGERFTWTMFKVSLDDARHLGRALLNLKKLRLFDLHESNIDDRHVQILVKDLIKISTLEELCLKNCRFSDQGALCVAKLMLMHPSLQRIILANNKIGPKGGRAIGYALTQSSCCPVQLLDLRLNPLGHDGVMGLFRALVRFQKVEELIISGCGFEDATGKRLATVIQLNLSLKTIDISNNWCKPAEVDIYNAVMTTTTLQWLDIRETDISEPYYTAMMKRLAKNRRGESCQELEEEEEEEEVHQGSTEEDNSNVVDQLNSVSTKDN